MHVAVVDRPAFRRDFDYMLLLPLRFSHVFAMADQLQVSEASKNRADQQECQAGHDHQTVGRSPVAIQIARVAVALGIYCYAASGSGVGTVFWHGVIRKKSAPPGISSARQKAGC